MNNDIYTQTLPQNTVKLLESLTQNKPDFLNKFYLSGGTALSLQLGHRESEDLDFFSPNPFDPAKIEQELHQYGTLSDTQLSLGTLNTYLNGVKLQFLLYPYRLIEEFVVWQGVKLSSVIDIACTKLQTISMRGSKKDFIDLYFLLQKFSLKELLVYSKKKYAESDYSETHILKSLVYFDDAETQPMPRMHQNTDWEKIKTSVIEAVRAIPLT